MALGLVSVPAHCCAQGRLAGSGAPVREQMSQAVELAQHGDPIHALEIVDALLERHPDLVPALKLEGTLLEEEGRRSDADAAYRKAFALAPSDPDMLLKIGTQELVAGNLDKAVALLQRRVRAVPDDEDGNYYLAQAYHLRGNNELALVSIQAALKSASDDPQVWQKYGELLCSSGENAKAIVWLTKAQNADPSLNRIDFDLAVASYNNMDLKAAEQYASNEMQLAPRNVQNLELLALIEAKLGEWESARDNFERVLAAKGKDAGALIEIGECDVKLKEYDAAIDSLNQSLELDPTQAQVHYLLSRAYSGEGNVAEAQHEATLHREMMQHLSLSMPKAQVRQENAISQQARQLLTQGHEAEALRLFETTDKGPYVTAGSAWMSVGAAYLAMDDSASAERSFQRGMTLAPNTRGIHTYLGMLALQQGNLSQAETDFEAELALDPNHPLALGELGDVRFRQGRWADAVDLLTKSKTTIPSLLYILCASQFELGKIQDADLTAEAVAAYDRNEPTIMKALDALLRRNGQAELAERFEHQP
jgi:predicted Zn-dependent protease